MRYFSLARLRSLRLPKSRKTPNDRPQQVEDLVGPGVGHPLGQGGKGAGQGGRHAHAAADQHVVADHVVVAAHGQQADVLAIDVRAVVAGQADAHLELSRQIGLAVQRLDLALGRLGLESKRPASRPARSRDRPASAARGPRQFARPSTGSARGPDRRGRGPGSRRHCDARRRRWPSWSGRPRGSA